MAFVKYIQEICQEVKIEEHSIDDEIMAYSKIYKDCDLNLQSHQLG